jgi:hypothetical protein
MWTKRGRNTDEYCIALGEAGHVRGGGEAPRGREVCEHLVGEMVEVLLSSGGGSGPTSVGIEPDYPHPGLHEAMGEGDPDVPEPDNTEDEAFLFN